MEKGGVGSSMDASVQDVWDWEVLPDEHRSFYAETRPAAAAASHSHGAGDELLLGVPVPDQETEEPILAPGAEADHVDDECKDIGVDVAAETRSEAQDQEESMPMPPAAEPLVSDAKEGVDEAPEAAAEEEEMKKGRARPDCVVFSVGKLRVNGIGALCSFGVAAATVCVFLAGGRLQHQHKIQQQQKIQLQFLGDDKRIQQVVQQTSRLNQAMSSMMGAGASTRANISFGGFYDGF